MDKETLIDDMMRDAVTDAKLFRTYDDDYEVIDRDQVMRCLANLDDAVKQLSIMVKDLSYESEEAAKTYSIDAIFTALTFMQNSLKSAVENEAEEAMKSKREMDAIGGKK